MKIKYNFYAFDFSIWSFSLKLRRNLFTNVHLQVRVQLAEGGGHGAEHHEEEDLQHRFFHRAIDVIEKMSMMQGGGKSFEKVKKEFWKINQKFLKKSKKTIENWKNKL